MKQDINLTAKKELTAEEVSSLLRISISTLHHLSRTGQVKASKVGKEWRYEAEDIYRRLTECLYHADDQIPQGGTDRRNNPRVNCFIQGHLSLPFRDGEASVWEGAILHLSESGILFEAYKVIHALRIQKEDSVKIELCLAPAGSGILRLNGLVRRIEENGKNRFGIQFEQHDELKPQLQAFVKTS